MSPQSFLKIDSFEPSKILKSFLIFHSKYSKYYLIPLNFRAPLIFAHLGRAKIKGGKFAQQGLKGREWFFWVRKNQRVRENKRESCFLLIFLLINA